MKLYVTPKGRWAGTQADAKAIGKEDGGFEQREVPIDKPSLLAFLNEWGSKIDAAGYGEGAEAMSRMIREERPASERPFSAESVIAKMDAPAAPVVAAAPSPLTLTQVETFIQNADHPKVASIFENCVYRARELVGGR